MDIQVVSSLFLLQIIIQSITLASLHTCKRLSRINSLKVQMLGQRQHFYLFTFFREARREYREGLSYTSPGQDGLVMLPWDVSSHAFMFACL